MRFYSLRNSFRQAVELIEANIAARSERYSIPWVLVLNEGAARGQLPIEQSGVPSALSTEAAMAASAQGISWHFFDRGVVVDLQGAYLGSPDDEDAAEKPWDEFLGLCRLNLKPGGLMVVYGLNGANPLVGSENLAHNIDHFNTFTDYSLTQVLKLGGFVDIKIMPLKLYVFWKNPLNYVGLAATTVLELFFRICFVLYGKDVKVLTKKLAAVCRNPG